MAAPPKNGLNGTIVFGSTDVIVNGFVASDNVLVVMVDVLIVFVLIDDPLSVE